MASHKDDFIVNHHQSHVSVLEMEKKKERMWIKFPLLNSVSIFGVLISTSYQVGQVSYYEAFIKIIFFLFTFKVVQVWIAISDQLWHSIFSW